MPGVLDFLNAFMENSPDTLRFSVFLKRKNWKRPADGVTTLCFNLCRLPFMQRCCSGPCFDGFELRSCFGKSSEKSRDDCGSKRQSLSKLMWVPVFRHDYHPEFCLFQRHFGFSSG